MGKGNRRCVGYPYTPGRGNRTETDAESAQARPQLLCGLPRFPPHIQSVRVSLSLSQRSRPGRESSADRHALWTRTLVCGRRKDKARPGIEPRVSLIPEARANRCTTGPIVGGITNSNIVQVSNPVVPHWDWIGTLCAIWVFVRECCQSLPGFDVDEDATLPTCTSTPPAPFVSNAAFNDPTSDNNIITAWAF